MSYSPWGHRESDMSEGTQHTRMQHILAVVCSLLRASFLK